MCFPPCVIPTNQIDHPQLLLSQAKSSKGKTESCLASELLPLNSLLFQTPKHSQADSTILDFILQYYEPLFLTRGESEGLGSFLRQGGTLPTGCLTTGEIAFSF